MKKFHCQFGKHYYKEKKPTSDRVKLQGTRKIGCPAHLHVHTIQLFPEFSISVDDLSRLGVRKLKEIKSKKLANLRVIMDAGDKKVEMRTKYYVLLPNKEAHHSYHKTCGEAGFSQKIHPKLVGKINELVSEGTTDAQEVKRALKRYVCHVLCPDQLIELSNRMYFPTTTDIRNHVYSAQKAMEMSKFDQDNLAAKITQWQNDSPTSKFHFIPYKDTEMISLDSTSYSTSQPLLYVHQEQWQQKLLKMYGNSITLMDATYKTTKYELPFFFVSVKTNVGYSVVADFIIQSETTEQITEALKILASWNPEWKPRNFMVDYSEAESSAIKNVFPGCNVYLCDFHREQCWERWVKERKHGLSQTDAETLLVLLRNCAWAPAATDTGQSIDHHYQEAVKNLKKSMIWIKNQQVREWLESKWLSIPQV